MTRTLLPKQNIIWKLTVILPNFRTISFWYKQRKRTPAPCKFEGRLCFKVTAYDYALNRLWSKAGSATNRVPTDTSSERKLRRDIQSTMFQTVINFGRRCFMLLMLVCHLFTRNKLIQRVEGWMQSVRRVRCFCLQTCKKNTLGSGLNNNVLLRLDTRNSGSDNNFEWLWP